MMDDSARLCSSEVISSVSAGSLYETLSIQTISITEPCTFGSVYQDLLILCLSGGMNV